MRRRPALVIGALTSFIALGSPLALASGHGLVDSGWWFKSERPLVVGLPLTSPLPAEPPEAEPGQLVVSATDGEATAIAALRFELADGVSAVELSLMPERATDGADIMACIAGSGWSGADEGNWANKPLVDCATGSAPVVSSDETSVVDVSRLQVGNVVDIVLVPTRGSSFEVVFGAPRTADLIVRQAPRTETDLSPPRPTSTLIPSPDPPPPATTPRAALPPTDLGQSATTSATRGIEPVERSIGPQTAATGSASSAASTSPVVRIVAAAIGLLAIALWVRSRPQPAVAVVGGLGGFIAERSGRPRSLR